MPDEDILDTEDPGDGAPEGVEAQGGDSEEKPAKIFGQYESLEAAEKGHADLRTWATKLSQENADLRRHLPAATEGRKTPDGAEVLNLIAENRGDEAIKAVVEARERERTAASARAYADWKAAKATEWLELIQLNPDAAQYGQGSNGGMSPIEELAERQPGKPLAHLLMMLEKANKKEPGRDMDAERKGAEKVIRTLQTQPSPLDAHGRGATGSAPSGLSKAELAIAKLFETAPAEYAKFKKR